MQIQACVDPLAVEQLAEALGYPEETHDLNTLVIAAANRINELEAQNAKLRADLGRTLGIAGEALECAWGVEATVRSFVPAAVLRCCVAAHD